MTMQPEKVGVADDVLGKISRMIWDLTRRLVEGSIDPHRCMHILCLARSGLRKKPFTLGTGGGGAYVLESDWVWDNSHLEYFTLDLEVCDGPGFESLLDDVDCSEQVRKDLLKRLTSIYEAQVPRHGSYRMRRLYRVYESSRYGQTSQVGNETIRRVDLHFIMVPICDFDEDGNPIAVSQTFDRAAN